MQAFTQCGSTIRRDAARTLGIKDEADGGSAGLRGDQRIFAPRDAAHFDHHDRNSRKAAAGSAWISIRCSHDQKGVKSGSLELLHVRARLNAALGDFDYRGGHLLNQTQRSIERHLKGMQVAAIHTSTISAPESGAPRRVHYFIVNFNECSHPILRR